MISFDKTALCDYDTARIIINMNLEVTPRDTSQEVKALRKTGSIPAVFYSRNTQSTPISVSLHDFEKVWREAGESTIITLKIGKETHDALIHDVDIHPVTREPKHVDFFIVEKGTTVTVSVPIEFVGEAPVEKQGGMAVKVMHEIEVEAAPTQLPSSIEVDISELIELSSHILVSDVELPEGVSATANPDDTVVSVTEAKEIEEEPVEEPDLEDIAVEGEVEGGVEEGEKVEGDSDRPQEDVSVQEEKGDPNPTH